MKNKGIMQFSFFTFLVVMILSSNAMGQEKKIDVKSKLDSIEGDVKRISITTDKGEVNFEGEEALLLFKRLKRNDIDMKIFSLDEDAEFDFFAESELSDDEGDVKKKLIKVEKNDGEMTVEITTYENGEKEVEVLEGEEAENYLEEMKSEGIIIERFKVEEGDDENCIIIDAGGKRKKIKLGDIKCHRIGTDSDSTKVIIMKKKIKKD